MTPKEWARICVPDTGVVNKSVPVDHKYFFLRYPRSPGTYKMCNEPGIPHFTCEHLLLLGNAYCLRYEERLVMRGEYVVRLNACLMAEKFSKP